MTTTRDENLTNYQTIAGKTYVLGCDLEDALRAGDTQRCLTIASYLQAGLYADDDDVMAWSERLYGLEGR